MEKKIKVLFLISTYSKNTGYIYVCLPEAMAKLKNVEVHVLTSQAQMYFDSPFYKEVYQNLHGEPILPEGKEQLADDLFLHRVNFDFFKTEIYLKNLYATIREIGPDVVHTFDCNSINAFKLALYKPILNYKLFPGNSIVLSVFPLDKEWDNASWKRKLGWKLKHVLPGRFISLMSSRIFPSTIDAGYIAENYFGAKKEKIEIAPLGIDTSLFDPANKNEYDSLMLRTSLGLEKDDFVCIYTGRMTEAKNPLILAQAIEWIAANTAIKNIKGLFLGDGKQVDDIRSSKNCIVEDFKSFRKLPKYYLASDIGVWPTQESTSMLDAAACGLPIIVSDRLKAIERIEGNGLQYKQENVPDLAQKILMLYRDTVLCENLGAVGAKKMREEYSWDRIARDRVKDYRSFM